MIPKRIHYCWFGGKKKPLKVRRCIRSWHRHCPNYEIIEWNEHNCPLSHCPPYVQQAHAAGMWAFVADYVRLKVVYDHGGIYLDTDVELLKSLDPLLDNHAYFGMEDKLYVNTGLGFGAEKGATIVGELLKDYESIPFIRPDGSYDKTACPVRNTPVFVRYGLESGDRQQYLRDDTLILPTEFFCPYSDHSREMHITTNTISIHWYAASWLNPTERRQQAINRKETQKRLRFSRKVEHTMKKLERIEKFRHICSQLPLISIRRKR